MIMIIMAGGTGGHIYPALAVASDWQQQGHKVFWLGSKNGMENKIVPDHQIEIDNINISGLRGNGLLGWILAPFKILKAIKQALKILNYRRPDVILGMGGFASGPGAVAAKLLRIPLVIHEQNAISGLTNKLLKPFANRVLQAFPDTLSGAKTVGNPVRSEIEAIALKPITIPFNILVTGGSLGAKIFNDIIPKVANQLDEKVQWWHQTGQNQSNKIRQQYNSLNNAKVVDFIDDMSEAFRWADVVICRSGAMSVFELSASGKPALLVPYPYAVDDHQSKNARYLTNNQAGLLVPQTDFNEKNLLNIVQSWLKNPDILNEMSQKSKDCYIPNATKKVIQTCLECCR